MIHPGYDSAKSAGLMQCGGCHKLLQPPTGSGDVRLYCPRCHTRVSYRRPHSLSYAWAYAITSLVLIFPANLYPIMTTIYLGEGEPTTILDGVILLIHHDMWPVAMIIFIASVAVPFLKLFGLFVLILSVQLRWNLNARQRTLMYRIVEWIGRWSMVDVFVIATLVALVDLAPVATIEAGIAASAFCALVVATMLGAMAFDPRLIWDNPPPAGN